MKVAAELRLKHGALFELCRDMGGTRALAEAIGIGHLTVHAWLHMRRCPTPGTYTKWYTKEVEQRLESLAGVPASELFPKELKDATAYFAKNTVHVLMKDIEPGRLLTMATSAQQRLTTSDPVDDAITSELTEQMKKAMEEVLNDRERTVVDCHYNKHMSFKEIGKVLGVSGARAVQIGDRAIRKMQQFKAIRHLIEFEPEMPPDFRKLDREFERQQNRSLQERFQD